MFDLNSTMFYKVKFTISAVNPEDDLLWKIVLHVRSWQTRKWNTITEVLPERLTKWTGIKFGGKIYSSNSDTAVQIESEFYVNENGLNHWACRITENHPSNNRFAPREWITEIGYEEVSHNMATFSVVLSYRDRPGYIGLCEDDPSSTIPKIIRNIINDSSLYCFSGLDCINQQPIELVPGEAPNFWNRITDSQRTLPYIYISPQDCDSECEGTTLFVNPSHLAQIICGNALVFYSKSFDFADEMHYIFPERYYCYRGAIRVYFPNIDVESESDSIRHRYLSVSTVNEFGKDNIYKIFRRALAQDVNFYESFFRIEDCRRLKEEATRRERLADLKNRHALEMKELADTTFESAFEMAKEEEEKRREAEECYMREADKVANLENDQKTLKGEIHNLKQQLDGVRLLAQKGKELEKASRSRFDITELPMSAESVVNYFVRTFSDRIAYSDDAIKSLKHCTLDSTVIWKVLYSLVTTMYELYIHGSSNMYTEFKSKTGIDCSRGEGSMTRQDKKLMRQFETQYHNETIDIETHITFAREEQSIHFGFSNECHKIVVGHCGEHLDIYSTRKRK